MKAIINDVEYKNIRWWIDSGIGMLEIVSNDPIIDVINTIGVNTRIYMYEDTNVIDDSSDENGDENTNENENESDITDDDTSNDELIAIWNIKGIERIYTVLDDGVRHIVIGFLVNLITDNTETIIHNDINISLDSILELADVVADTEETTKLHTATLEQLQTTIENYNARVAQLESLINTIPNNITDRLDALTTRDNALAERIANIENHLG